MKKKRKILIVAMADSIHTARWIAQITDQNWEIHLFPAVDWGVAHQELKDIIVHHSFYTKRDNPGENLRLKGINVGSTVLSRGLIYFYTNKFPNYRIKQLNRLIKRLKPDIIHSMEFSLAGYLVMAVKNSFKGQFPKWIATNWGSDIYLFGQLRKHKKKIQEILENCDYYSCECHRDVCLAKNYGLKGMSLPVFPNTGGFNLEKIKKFRVSGRTSRRKFIALKGYQNWAGRALVGLRALERCADILKGYTVGIYSTFKGSDVEVAAELFTKKTGIKTEVVYETTHQNILKLHGKSRISLGVNISDAISTSLLEAMIMGSFPIQSNTSCADEWVKNGKTGILVPPEDPDIIEKAIRRALKDDGLVDEAARLNWRIAQKRLDQKRLKKQIIDFYQLVFDGKEV